VIIWNSINGSVSVWKGIDICEVHTKAVNNIQVKINIYCI